MRIATIGLLAAASLGLGGCAYNGLGVGVGYGSGYGDPYGYSGYGYDPYGYRSAYYNPYGYSRYGSPYGWYNGFYYPGSGWYVWDRDGNRREITREEKRYFDRAAASFADKIRQSRGLPPANGTVSTQSQTVGSATVDRPVVRQRAIRVDQRSTRAASAERVRTTQTERRSERAAERAAARESRRSDRDDD
jgi:hypothetical protein